MAKKNEVRYSCSQCGYVSLSPVGRCPKCGEWGSVEQELISSGPQGARPRPMSPQKVLGLKPPRRFSSGIGELDRVLGGGMVEGGVVLLGGQPGIGKSTLLLQVCGNLARLGSKVLYVSGEESASQVALRSSRLGADVEGLEIFCHSDVDGALEVLSDHGVLVVDSVQAMKTGEESGWPGTPTQVRAVAQRCIDVAKSRGIPTVLVGHITKEGRIAGPMLLEHMVDTVLLFSGEESSAYRVLRASKNRYGGTDEVGLFQMEGRGLKAVEDPSGLYWNRGDESVPGVAVTVVMEGSRPLVAEVQALAATTVFPYPKRTARGFSLNKLHLLLAVIQKRCGLSTSGLDVYANVAGGLDLRDPGADLALAMALVSSASDRALPSDCCLLGEVGLVGEIRPVGRTPQRLKEAARLGFKTAVVSAREGEELPSDVKVIRVRSLAEAVASVGLG
nr:DNA repair protein RadA [uncultured Dethiosulfovibrio sp.]